MTAPSRKMKVRVRGRQTGYIDQLAVISAGEEMEEYDDKEDKNKQENIAENKEPIIPKKIGLYKKVMQRVMSLWK